MKGYSRKELIAVLKQAEDLEQLLTDLLAAKQRYDDNVDNILRRTFDDE